jgi:hypothetical protein
MKFGFEAVADVARLANARIPILMDRIRRIIASVSVEICGVRETYLGTNCLISTE